MVLEGGSLTVDGQGTLITTEQCLLNENRNPGLTREAIEAELKRCLGIEKVIWLRYGHFEDSHTDGHVDGVCTYARPGVVVAQTCEDPANPNFRLMAENLEILRSAMDAAGRPLEVIELPQLPYFDLDGEELMVSYVNFYVANGGVVVPIAGHPMDTEALSIIASAFPERESSASRGGSSPTAEAGRTASPSRFRWRGCRRDRLHRHRSPRRDPPLAGADGGAERPARAPTRRRPVRLESRSRGAP